MIVAPSLTPRKEVTHGSCKEAGLEEDHQERGQEARGQEGQVTFQATVYRLTKNAPVFTGAVFFGWGKEKRGDRLNSCFAAKHSGANCRRAKKRTLRFAAKRVGIISRPAEKRSAALRGDMNWRRFLMIELSLRCVSRRDESERRRTLPTQLVRPVLTPRQRR